MIVKIYFKKLTLAILASASITSGCTQSSKSTQVIDRNNFGNQERTIQVCEGRTDIGSQGSLHNWKYNEPIQIRTGAGINYTVMYTGQEGNRVEILDFAVAQDSFCWLKIQ